MAVTEALEAAKKGNFGVGAVLADEMGNIICRAQNQVFHPTFRSDLHAEMSVISHFEERLQDRYEISTLTLYTSLEPCPMCYSRLLVSGIRQVYYAAEDLHGGMVHKSEHMPAAWHDLAKGKRFELADCSAELKALALEIFQTTVNEADARLISRH